MGGLRLRRREKFVWRQRPSREAGLADGPLEEVDLVDAHADRGSSGALGSEAQLGCAVQLAVDVAAKLAAVIDRGDVIPVAEGLQTAAVQQGLACVARLNVGVQAPLLVDRSDLKQHAVLAVRAGRRVFIEVKPALLHGAAVRAKYGFPGERLGVGQRVNVQQDGVVVPVELNRLAVRGVDDARIAKDLGRVTSDVEWHLRRRLAPLLFEEEDRAGARALRQSPVEKAQVSASTKAKAASKQTPEGLPVHSFQTLLADLGTLTLNQVTLPDAPQHPFPMVAKPTPLQAKAFDLLGVDPGKSLSCARRRDWLRLARVGQCTSYTDSLLAKVPLTWFQNKKLKLGRRLLLKIKKIPGFSVTMFQLIQRVFLM